MPGTEREIMLSGQMYSPADPELSAARERARQLTRRFNTTESGEERLRILHELFGQTGDIISIEPPFYCDYGSNIYLGNRVYMNFGCVILDCAEVRIGNDVMFGPNVQLFPATHPLDPIERASGRELAKPITIGSHVWIGGGAIILPGVTIGDGTTIGAGSVVTKDIPSDVVAVGNPARVIRMLK